MDSSRGTNNGEMRLARNTVEGWKPQWAPRTHTSSYGITMINELGS